MNESHDAREIVRRRYAELAVAAPAGDVCCGPGDACVGPPLYSDGELDQLPQTAVNASLGCGNPLAVAALGEGEVVLDLGSGGGIDVILSARRVGPTGKACGLGMTDEMLELARANASRRRQRRVPEGPHRGHPPAGRVGRRGDLQLRDQSVIGQGRGPDRGRQGAAPGRALRRDRCRGGRGNGRGDPPGHGTVDRLHCRGPDEEGVHRPAEIGRVGEVDVEETHRVHPQAGSAIIRARKPTG